MSDDLFDNGIDGEPFGRDMAEEQAECFSEDMYEEYEMGGYNLYTNEDDETKITYYCGQWNDSGVDPDRISIKCNYMSFKDEEYYVSIGEESAWIGVPGRKSFELKVKFDLSDFVEVDSPIDISVHRRFNFSEMVDLLSEKKIKFVFDKEKFKTKLERYRGLLAFS